MKFEYLVIAHFQYAPTVITTNIVKKRGERFSSGRCIFLVKMCSSYEVDWVKLKWVFIHTVESTWLFEQAPKSALRAYEDSYQCSASIYTRGKVKLFLSKRPCIWSMMANCTHYFFQPLQFLASSSQVFIKQVWRSFIKPMIKNKVNALPTPTLCDGAGKKNIQRLYCSYIGLHLRLYSVLGPHLWKGPHKVLISLKNGPHLDFIFILISSCPRFLFLPSIRKRQSISSIQHRMAKPAPSTLLGQPKSARQEI